MKYRFTSRTYVAIIMPILRINSETFTADKATREALSNWAIYIKAQRFPDVLISYVSI